MLIRREIAAIRWSVDASRLAHRKVGDSRIVIPDRTLPLAPERPEIEPDSVDPPELEYGERGTTLRYPRRDAGWARVVFHRLDALRVCRGEHSPYEEAAAENDSFHRISIVRPSSWLRERYEYEHHYYGNSYNFSGNVDEMLHEFEHYLFCFHDEFVEVIAGGVHFHRSDDPDDREPYQRPGWADLPESYIADRWLCSGITCQVRVDSRPRDAILAASRLCDQSIVQVALELDGHVRVTQRLCVRTRDSETKSRWRDDFGGRVNRTFDSIPQLDELRPFIEEYAAEVQARRATMRRR